MGHVTQQSCITHSLSGTQIYVYFIEYNEFTNLRIPLPPSPSPRPSRRRASSNQVTAGLCTITHQSSSRYRSASASRPSVPTRAQSRRPSALVWMRRARHPDKTNRSPAPPEPRGQRPRGTPCYHVEAVIRPTFPGAVAPVPLPRSRGLAFINNKHRREPKGYGPTQEMYMCTTDHRRARLGIPAADAGYSGPGCAPATKVYAVNCSPPCRRWTRHPSGADPLPPYPNQRATPLPYPA